MTVFLRCYFTYLINCIKADLYIQLPYSWRSIFAFVQIQFVFKIFCIYNLIQSIISFKKMSNPDPQLLSLLEKVANPLQALSVSVRVHGVYAPPEQWKLTDEANPNIFAYSIKVLGQDFLGGKIEPRKLTEKEVKQLQQKNKKGGKKETKQQQKPVEVNHAEQQRKQREWNALSEQQKFYRIQEDPYKAFSLAFADKQKVLNYTAEDIPGLQSKINNNSIEVLLTRKPEMSEDDLQKLKKSKPKNLNLGELYAAAYRGIINMKQLQRPGSKHIKQRVKLSFTGNAPDDGIKIQTDSCYVYIQFEFSDPITPQVKELNPSTEQVIPVFSNQSAQSDPILRMKNELRKSIRAISQQYITCFLKQKEHTEDKRHGNLGTLSTLRLNEINKRKEIFLNQFVNSGKFTILKQRISKSLKAVIIDKFRKEKVNNKFDSQQISETLSQLNLYFQEQFTKTIDDFMATDSSTIHEDLVLGYEHSRQHRKNTIAPIINQTEIQRETRLANQYGILQRKSEVEQYKSQSHYQNILILSDYSHQAKENYARFCLRSKKFHQAYILFSEVARQTGKLQYKLIQAALLVDRRRIPEATELLDELIADPQASTVHKINYTLLLSFMHERENDIKNSEKYLAIAERYYKIKNNPHLKFTPVKNPYELPKPKVPKPERYISQLSHGQSQQIRLNFISILAQLNLYNLVSEYLPKLEESNRKTILDIEVDIFKKSFEEALDKIQIFLKKSDNIRNIEYLLIKAEICYQSEKMFQCEEIFLNILQLKPPQPKILHIYLRLGFIYLSRKSWEDARSVFEKACEHKYNCSVAWFGLGVANLNIGKYDQAEEALNLSKIYNPLSKQTDQYQKNINQFHRKKSKLGYERKADEY